MNTVETPTATSPPLLEYGRRSRFGFIGRNTKKLIFLALCLAFTIPIYRNWGPLKHRVLWFYWFNQAMAFRMPEKPVDLRITDLTNSAQAISQDPAYQQMTEPGTKLTLAGYVPAVFRRLMEHDSRLNLANGPAHAVAFLGRMDRPDGTPRLVIVTHSDGLNSQILNQTGVLVLPVPGWTDPLPPTVTSQYRWWITYAAVNKNTLPISGLPRRFARLRSGTIDPTDRSHLVFEFTIGDPVAQSNLFVRSSDATSGTSGVIDARLENDDALYFSLRTFSGTDPNLRAWPISLSGDVPTIQANPIGWNWPPGKLLPATIPRHKE